MVIFHVHAVYPFFYGDGFPVYPVPLLYRVLFVKIAGSNHLRGVFFHGYPRLISQLLCWQHTERRSESALFLPLPQNIAERLSRYSRPSNPLWIYMTKVSY